MKNLKRLSKMELKKVVGGVCSHWISVTASCGKTYSLCSDNYSNGQQLEETVRELDDIKC